MQIRSHGFKGHPVAVTVGPRTVLLGPNGSGKSTVLFDLRYALVGHDPALGKTLDATAAVLSAKEGVVDVTLDDGRTIHRALTDTGKGLRAEAACSWVSERGQEPHELAAQKLVAEDLEDVVEILDIRTLFALSANRRAARLERILLSAAAPVADKAAAVARYVTQRLTETADERLPPLGEKAALAGLQASIPAAQRALIKELWPQFKATLASQGLPGALAWAHEGKKAVTRQATQATQAKRALDARVAELPVVPEGAIAALDARRDTLVAAAGAAEVSATQAAALRQKIAVADAAIATHQAALDQLLPRVQEAMQDEARQTLGAAREAATARVRQFALGLPEPDLTRANALLAEAEARTIEAEGIAATLPLVPPEPTTGEITEAERALEAVRGSAWSEVRQIAITVTTIAAKLKGASAGTIRNHMSTLDALAGRHLEADPGVLAQRLIDLRTAYENAKLARMDVLDARARLEGHVARLREEAATLQASAAACREEALAPWRAAQAEREAAVAEEQRLEAAYQACLRDADRLIASVKDEEQALERSQAARQALGDPPPDVDAQGARDELLRVTTELQALRQAEAARRELATVTAELERLRQLGAVYPAIHWAAERVRNEEIEDTGAPLRARQAQFFAGAGLTQVRPYVRAGRDSCELGWVVGEAEVPVQALSGGEWVLFATAFVAAILALRPPAALRPLLVEGAELDDAHFHMLLDGIAAVGDAVTHAVVATCHAPETLSDAWEVLDFPVPAPRLMAPGAA